MAAARCLSDLPDDLLRHVLSFTPSKEAASTAVLSRRWRSLWRTSGAVNIDSRSYSLSAEARERFVRGVQAALDAAHRSPIRRLTVHVEIEAKTHGEVKKKYLLLSWAKESEHDFIDAVLSHPAAKGVEVLHIGAHRVGCKQSSAVEGFYKLSCGALPAEALRVLHITNCSHLMPAPPGTTTFPQLAELRLQGCCVSLEGLQDMINVAPHLVTLQLECVYLYYNDEEGVGNDSQTPRCYRLCCPSVTAVLLAHCRYPCWVQGGIELDVPRLRYLRFKGSVRSDRFEQVSMTKSQALPDMERVDIHLTDDIDPFENKIRSSFWQFLGNFSKVKALKLKLDYPIDHVAVIEKKDQDQLLCSTLFRNLKCLELQGSYEPSSRVAAMAIANLLHTCPVLSDLRLKLRKALRPSITSSHFRLIARERARLDFHKSVDHFKRCRNTLGVDGHDNTYEVSDISSLRGHSFKCMQNCLTRLSLQFQMIKPNCFGTQLAKFFAQNAMVLEEMYIDDGIHRICEHMNLTQIGRWSADSSNGTNSLTVASKLRNERGIFSL